MRKQILDDSSVAAFSQLGASFFAAARARLAEPRAEEGPPGWGLVVQVGAPRPIYHNGDIRDINGNITGLYIYTYIYMYII